MQKNFAPPPRKSWAQPPTVSPSFLPPATELRRRRGICPRAKGKRSSSSPSSFLPTTIPGTSWPMTMARRSRSWRGPRTRTGRPLCSPRSRPKSPLPLCLMCIGPAAGNSIWSALAPLAVRLARRSRSISRSRSARCHSASAMCSRTLPSPPATSGCSVPIPSECSTLLPSGTTERRWKKDGFSARMLKIFRASFCIRTSTTRARAASIWASARILRCCPPPCAPCSRYWSGGSTRSPPLPAQ